MFVPRAIGVTLSDVTEEESVSGTKDYTMRNSFGQSREISKNEISVSHAPVYKRLEISKTAYHHDRYLKYQAKFYQANLKSDEIFGVIRYL